MALLVCVCMGAWGVYVGIEEISGIASQCSCPEWETQRNRYMVHVFQVGKKQRKKERLIKKKNNTHQVVQMSNYVCECAR